MTPTSESPAAYVEHVNAVVGDLDATTAFLLAALPDWRVRGEGDMNWYGTPIRWRHVGDDAHYVALQSGGGGADLDWRSHLRGVKHVGIVVPSVEAVVSRLAAAGWPLDHWGHDLPARRNVYVNAPDGLQFEFVEYRTQDMAARNRYEG